DALASARLGHSTVEEAGAAAGTRPTLTEGRMIDDAEDGAPFVKKRYEGAEEGLAGDEGLGAVDGIEHPDVGSARVLGAMLLADDAVVGEVRLDAPAHGRLGLAVGDGDG